MEQIKSFLLFFANSLGDVLEFGFKALIVVIAFALCTRILSKIRPSSFSNKKKLRVENLKKKYEKYQDQFYHETLNKKDLKLYLSEKKNLSQKKSWKEWLFSKGEPKSVLPKIQEEQADSTQEKNLEKTIEATPLQDKQQDSKAEKNQQKESSSQDSKLSSTNSQQSLTKKTPTLFVLSFEGDIMATGVKNLREEISVVLNLAKPEDEILLLLESRGGSVSHYGLAANQLQRIRNHNIPLTICVDRVAGSGGYLMACVGNQILAAPFAFIGSIGVMAGIPNIHELMKKYNVSYEEFTAGKYKRTVTPLGEITEEKKQRLQEQLSLIHSQFKNFVSRYREINIEEVATGEAWLAESALEKGLVDQLKCSDDYIREKTKTHAVYKISLKTEKTNLEKWLDKKKKPLNQLLEEFTTNDFFI